MLRGTGFLQTFDYHDNAGLFESFFAPTAKKTSKARLIRD